MLATPVFGNVIQDFPDSSRLLDVSFRLLLVKTLISCSLKLGKQSFKFTIVLFLAELGSMLNKDPIASPKKCIFLREIRLNRIKNKVKRPLTMVIRLFSPKSRSK